MGISMQIIELSIVLYSSHCIKSWHDFVLKEKHVEYLHCVISI